MTRPFCEGRLASVKVGAGGNIAFNVDIFFGWVGAIFSKFGLGIWTRGDLFLKLTTVEYLLREMEIWKFIGDLRAIYFQPSSLGLQPIRGGGRIPTMRSLKHSYRPDHDVHTINPSPLPFSNLSSHWSVKLRFGSKERRKSPSGLRFFLKARVERGGRLRHVTLPLDLCPLLISV